MTTPITGTNPAAPPASNGATPPWVTTDTTRPATGRNELGQDAFLKLLVAQLKYQDPMNPADGAKFMQQTAQFTMVETLEEIVDQNTQMLSASRLLGASTMIGRQVTYIGADGFDMTGTVSAARFDSDRPLLTVDGVDIPLGAVKEVLPAAEE